VSECPLAGVHILQTMQDVVGEDGASRLPETVPHPVELMAKAYGIKV
jgi:glycerol-3-phosphate dehydrogenase subunit C